MSRPVPTADAAEIQQGPVNELIATDPALLDQDLQMMDAPLSDRAAVANHSPLPTLALNSTAVTASVSASSNMTPANNSAASPLPARIGTPKLGGANGDNYGTGPGSRATSAHPADGLLSTATTMPAEAAPHGAPARQYLNAKVTPALLDGMKMLARERPQDPLRVLGEFLLQRSKELENGVAPT